MLPLTLNFVKTQWRLFANAHPLAKGALSYALLWPSASLIQQTCEGKNLKTYDYLRCLRFSIFGALYVAPTLYGWVRLTSVMWPQTNLRVGITKAITEQLTYGPFACVSFFVGMSLLELKTFDEAVKEAQTKFWPTYKVGVCFWPILQTINFAMVPERNRLIVVSCCSLVWTSFLAYMKKIETDAAALQTPVPLIPFTSQQQQLSLHAADGAFNGFQVPAALDQ